MNPLIACGIGMAAGFIFGMAFGVLIAGLASRSNDPDRLERARQWWGGGL
jgi:hypothetical protein